MNKQELRIGNLIYWVNQANPLSKTVIAVTPEMLISMPDKKDSPYQPIPLTDELLLRFGFKKWNNPSQNLHLSIFDNGTSGFKLDFDFIEGKFYLKSRYDEENLRCQRYNNMLYVHQLMNFYFALTGTELAFKNQEEKI